MNEHPSDIEPLHPQPFGGPVNRCTISVPGGGRCRCRDHLVREADSSIPPQEGE